MSARLEVVYCDNHLLVVLKPAGIPAVPDETRDESLFDLAKDFVRAEFDKKGAVFLGIVHRLDRPVSGVMVFARTSKAASRLSEQFRSRVAKKVYWGVGLGEQRTNSGAVSQWLEKDQATNRVRVLASGLRHAKQAVTCWKVLERQPGRVLYELEPETGRPHQLRVACASLATPLAGDLKYGALAALVDKSIGLHARALDVTHPTRDERLHFEAPAPALAIWDFDTTRA